MFSNDVVAIMVNVLKGHDSKFAKEVAENVIVNSDGKTKERLELLKFWKELDNKYSC